MSPRGTRSGQHPPDGASRALSHDGPATDFSPPKNKATNLSPDAKVGALQSFRVALRQLNHGLRGTPLGRFQTWLGRQSDGSLHAPCTKSELPASPMGLRSQEQQLLPSHLPTPEDSLFSKTQLSSKRRRQRRHVRRIAWRLGQLVSGSFSYFELGAPKSEAEYEDVMGTWRVTPRQEAAFVNIVEDLAHFIRSSPQMLLGSGRGLKNLRQLIDLYDRSWSKYDVLDGSTVNTKSLIPSALEVDPSRVFVPLRAGSARPEDFL